jgi:hypothetical protein
MKAQRWIVGALATGALGAAIACGSSGGAFGGAGGAAAGSQGSGAMSGSGGGLTVGTGDTCTNLECKQVPCSGNAKTTVSGTVYAPEGTLPLYNVLVYVPNAPLDAIVDGASCEKCGSVSGQPLVSTITDTKGNFSLAGMPVGTDIPLVIQVGKWRRTIKLPKVDKCVDNPVDKTLTRLPKNQAEGHIPKIALTTGGADILECLLRSIGIAPEEFTPSSGTGRVNLYAGFGGSSVYASTSAPIEPAQPFWSSLDNLSKYDVVLLSCEGNQWLSTKPMAARQAMQDYANKGGRIFMSHWHNGWLQAGPMPWPTVANWHNQGDPFPPYYGLVDVSFPKGQALSDWLMAIGATQLPGLLPIQSPKHTLTTVNAPAARQWVVGAAQDTGSVKYFTFNAPVGADDDKMCGRVVFSDIHVSSGNAAGKPFPTGCVAKDMSPQEKALVFMLFDLSSCIQNDDKPPIPPAK